MVSSQVAVSSAVGSALVADLIPKGLLGKAMAFFSAASWIGGVVGFAVTGFAIQSVGYTLPFLFAALLPLISIGLMTRIHFARPALNAHF